MEVQKEKKEEVMLKEIMCRKKERKDGASVAPMTQGVCGSDFRLLLTPPAYYQ